MWAIIIGILGLLLGLWWNRRLWFQKYPPGAWSLPLIGHIPYFAQYAKLGGLPRLFMAWKNIYGPIFTTDFGTFKAIVIGELGVLKEAWSMPQLTGRIDIPKVRLRSSNGKGGPMRGVLFTHGQTWSEQRNLMMKHLRKYNTDDLDEIIRGESKEVYERIMDAGSMPILTGQLFNPAIINVIRQIVAGDRFANDDPDLTLVMDAITDMLLDKGMDTITSYLPQKVIEFFPNVTGWKKFSETAAIPRTYFTKIADEHIRLFDAGNPKMDFIDTFIAIMNVTDDPKSSFYKDVGKENLIQMIMDFFDSGVETTCNFLNWMMLLLALHPDVQHRLQSEIDGVIGSDRLPSLKDRPRMPFTEATVQETLRKASAVPLGLLHRSLDNVTLRDFKIPQNSILISNLYGIHHDPEVWGPSVDEFEPNRFLSNPNLSESMIPFGTGKRLCPGEYLGRCELFLFATLTFQRFNVEVDPNAPRPTMIQQSGGIMGPPQPHYLIFRPRF